MPILSIMMVLAAWMIPVVRMWVSWRKSQAAGHAWLVTAGICFAMFQTFLQDGTTDVLAGWFGRGTVYAVCSLSCLVMLIAFLRYQRIYQQAMLTPHAQYIPGLHGVHRGLTIILLFASFVVFTIEGFWFRAWIDMQSYMPLAIVLDRGPLVVSRVCFMVSIIVGLWGGMIYPYLYLVWHRHRLDPAFREQGGHWRLACFAGTAFVTTLSGLVHGSATVLSHVQSHATDTWVAAAYGISMVNGPILVTGMLISCLPQHMYWSAQAYRFYRRLLPLHAQMQKLVAGVYLDVPKPRIWDILSNPVQPIIALKRVQAEITDARFLCYGEASSNSTLSFSGEPAAQAYHLASVAQYERDMLWRILYRSACPSEANQLNVAAYQSLDYYLHLARILRIKEDVEHANA
jgi:hypothetical protein